MKHKRKGIGLPPGSVVFTGSRKVEKIQLHRLQYNADSLQDQQLTNREEILLQPSTEKALDWYDLRGLHDTKLIETLGKTFGIHPLILEDIADTQQRPKFEEHENGLFIIIKALHFNEAESCIDAEHVAIYFRNGLLLSFQETATDLFASVRKRIHSSSGRIRQRGADYLAYALMDTLVDHYFLVLEALEERIEKVEEEIMSAADSQVRDSIHQLKRELISARKRILPLREAVSRLIKADHPVIQDNTTVFMLDLYDHVFHIMDTVEAHRDTLNGLQDLYLSEISYKMNSVIQVLTIITTIFVRALSFLTGLYGMNFDHMPELHWKYGYFVLLGVMAVLVIWFLWYFIEKEEMALTHR